MLKMESGIWNLESDVCSYPVNMNAALLRCSSIFGCWGLYGYMGGVACITILKTPRGHQLLSNLVRSSFEITGITKILKSTKKYYWYGNWSRRLYFVIDKSLGGDKAV